MPANKKYLSSPWSRAGKISAGFLGGFLFSVLLHNAIGALLTERAGLLMTSAYSTFLVWAGCLVYAFSVKKAWVAWMVLLLGSGICLAITFAAA